MNINKQYVDYKKNSWGYNSMDPSFITFHNTSNNASAQNERDYVQSQLAAYNGATTYHFAVDDKEVIQLLPLNVNGWHAGDGSGSGNMKSIGIEVCYTLEGSSGFSESKYKAAEANAIELMAYLCESQGISTNNIKLHYDWSGKDCPKHTIDEHNNNPAETRTYLKTEVNKKMESNKDFNRGSLNDWSVGGSANINQIGLKINIDEEPAYIYLNNNGQQYSSYGKGFVENVSYKNGVYSCLINTDALPNGTYIIGTGKYDKKKDITTQGTKFDEYKVIENNKNLNLIIKGNRAYIQITK